MPTCRRPGPKQQDDVRGREYFLFSLESVGHESKIISNVHSDLCFHVVMFCSYGFPLYYICAALALARSAKTTAAPVVGPATGQSN